MELNFRKDSWLSCLKIEKNTDDVISKWMKTISGLIEHLDDVICILFKSQREIICKLAALKPDFTVPYPMPTLARAYQRAVIEK